METNNTYYPTAEMAYIKFAQFLRINSFYINHTLPKHNFKHSLIKTPKIDFYCLFRKGTIETNTFQNFNKYFPEFINKFPNYAGRAEGINKEVIEKITNPIYLGEKQIVLIYIYQNGAIYTANPFTFKKFAENNNLIRQHKTKDRLRDYGGGYKDVIETVYYTPLKEPFIINFNIWLEENNKSSKEINKLIPREDKELQLTPEEKEKAHEVVRDNKFNYSMPYHKIKTHILQNSPQKRLI